MLPVGPVLGLFKSVYFVYVFPLFFPLFWAVVWAVMEKKKGLLPLILPLIFPRGWPFCFASCAFRWWPSGGRALGPSGGFWAPLVALSGVLSGVRFLFRFPSLEAWFSFGLFRAFNRAKISPPLSRVLSREKANFGPRKAEPEAEPERRKAGLSCVLSCVLEGPLPPRGRGYLPEGRRPPFAGGLPVGRGQTRGKKAPPAFYSTSGKT